MAKRKTSRGGRRLRSVPSKPAPSRELLVAGQVLDSFTPDFVRWYEATLGESTGSMECLTVMRTVLAACADLTGGCSATTFPPATVRTVLDATRAWDDEMADGFSEAWHLYVDFLDGTGRWSGTPDEYTESHRLVAAHPGEGTGAPPPVEVPEFGAEEEAAAFTELELIRRTSAMLSWLGSGRSVTSTGVLRLKDVAPAAETVGVRVRAQWNAGTADQALAGSGAGGSGDVPVVRSMHEVPVLRTVWNALREAGILTVGSTAARPTESARQWLHGTGAQRAEVYRRFTTQFLRAAVAPDRTARFFLVRTVDADIAAAQTAVLLAGCTAQPVPRERLETVGGENELDRYMAGVMFERIRAGLDELRELGLLDLDTHYRVQPVVVRCVLAAFGEDGEPTEVAVEPAVHQLKIALRDARPPVWRRVLVPSTMRLDELHDVIQRVFDWENSHLHVFSTGNGYDGSRYAPVDPSGLLDLEETEDEAAVPLGALLRHVGDKLTYLYDFGDDWFHDIVLEKVEDAGTAQELPRCTGGRGAAPTEDSGGVWGWAGLVEAVNDPAHPEHENMREWLDLDPGETFDPKAFDAADADAALDVLR